MLPRVFIAILVLGCSFLSVDARETTSDVIPSILIGISPLTGMLHTQSASRNRRSDVQTTPMEKYGICDYDQYIYNIMACTALLYRGYRDSTVKKTCRDQIPHYLNCTLAVLRSCVTNATTFGMRERIMTITLESNEFEKVACDEGGYSDTLSPQITKFCKSEIKSAYTKCITPFRRMFKADPGDPKLCSEKEKTTDCSTNAMAKYCSGDDIPTSISETRALNVRSVNPYCTVEQGGSNPDRILAGKLYDIPVNAASSLTYPFSVSFAIFVILLNYFLTC